MSTRNVVDVTVFFESNVIRCASCILYSMIPDLEWYLMTMFSPHQVQLRLLLSVLHGNGINIVGFRPSRIFPRNIVHTKVASTNILSSSCGLLRLLRTSIAHDCLIFISPSHWPSELRNMFDLGKILHRNRAQLPYVLSYRNGG